MRFETTEQAVARVAYTIFSKLLCEGADLYGDRMSELVREKCASEFVDSVAVRCELADLEAKHIRSQELNKKFAKAAH